MNNDDFRHQIACAENANLDIASNNFGAPDVKTNQQRSPRLHRRSKPASRNCALQVRNFDEQEAATHPTCLLCMFIASTIPRWGSGRKTILMRLTAQYVRNVHHPLRALIEVANGTLEAKTASRWTRALEYALSEDEKPTALLHFLRANGGIAGCERIASKDLPKHMSKRNDWV